MMVGGTNRWAGGSPRGLQQGGTVRILRAAAIGAVMGGDPVVQVFAVRRRTVDANEAAPCRKARLELRHRPLIGTVEEHERDIGVSQHLDIRFHGVAGMNGHPRHVGAVDGELEQTDAVTVRRVHGDVRSRGQCRLGRERMGDMHERSAGPRQSRSAPPPRRMRYVEGSATRRHRSSRQGALAASRKVVCDLLIPAPVRHEPY